MDKRIYLGHMYGLIQHKIEEAVSFKTSKPYHLQQKDFPEEMSYLYANVENAANVQLRLGTRVYVDQFGRINAFQLDGRNYELWES